MNLKDYGSGPRLHLEWSRMRERIGGSLLSVRINEIINQLKERKSEFEKAAQLQISVWEGKK